VGAERDTELAADLGDDLRRVVVVAETRDPVGVDLGAHHGMHLVAGPPEENQFPPVRTELTTRRSHRLVTAFRTAEERSVQA
jgi:hypothetical protein